MVQQLMNAAVIAIDQGLELNRRALDAVYGFSAVYVVTFGAPEYSLGQASAQDSHHRVG
jgi:hypothetical protein